MQANMLQIRKEAWRERRSSLGSAEIAFADDREMGIPGLQQKSFLQERAP
jgi:hypothetical protein